MIAIDLVSVIEYEKKRSADSEACRHSSILACDLEAAVHSCKLTRFVLLGAKIGAVAALA